MSTAEKATPTGEKVDITSEVTITLARKSYVASSVYVVLFAVISANTTFFADLHTESMILGGLLFFFGVSRFGLATLRLRPGEPEPKWWRHAFSFVVFGASATWGAFCYLVIMKYGATKTSFAVLLPTAGIASGSILSLAPASSLIFAHLSLVLLPAIAAFYFLPAAAEVGVFSALIGVYYLYLLVQAFSISGTVRSNMVKSSIISKQKLDLEEALNKASTASVVKERFTTMMSHEIRTPLNGIIGATDLMLAEERDAAKREQLHMIQTSGENLLLILTSILDFSSMEASRFVLEKRVFDMWTCLRETVRVFDSIAKKKSVDLALFIDPSLPHDVVGDAVNLKRVLVTIVGNALKFTDRGHVEVRAELRSNDASGPRVRITVSDTGAGLSAEDLRNVFEPYNVIGGAGGVGVVGMGLNLAICKKICALMDGEITGTSEVGKGSTFRFEIKLEASVARGPVDEKNSRGNILIVDDDQARGRAFALIVERAGYSPSLATSAGEAVECVNSSRFELVFVNFRIREFRAAGSGYGAALTKAIRGDRFHAMVPILGLISANDAEEAELKECFECGMNDGVPAPKDAESMAAMIRRFAHVGGGMKWSA